MLDPAGAKVKLNASTDCHCRAFTSC